jgi:hypothetical protein
MIGRLLVLVFLVISNLMVLGQFPTTITPLPQLNKEFQVVAHIVMDKDTFPPTGQATSLPVTPSSVNAVLSTVNSYFSPIGVSFNVCEVRYIYNFQYFDTMTDATIQEMVNQNFAVNRINIYYFNSFISNATAGRCFGNISSSGYICIKTNVPKVVAHELGHYFSLGHTFGSGVAVTSELVNASNCSTTGDGICDTPADPYVESVGETAYVDVNDNCNYIYTGRDANNEFYNPDIGNIMSYYSSCNNCSHFTHGQYKKMADFYNSTFNFSSKDRW